MNKNALLFDDQIVLSTSMDSVNDCRCDCHCEESDGGDNECGDC